MPEPEVIYVRVSRDVKERILKAANDTGMTLNAWAANTLRCAAEGHGLPPAPPARHPLPTTADTVAAYIKGERLLGPCGQKWPCKAADGPQDTISGIDYCECGLRIS